MDKFIELLMLFIPSTADEIKAVENDDESFTKLKGVISERIKSIRKEGHGKGLKDGQKELVKKAQELGVEVSEDDVIATITDKMLAKASENKEGAIVEPTEIQIKESKFFKDFENKTSIREAEEKSKLEKQIKKLEEDLLVTTISQDAITFLNDSEYSLPEDEDRAENLRNQYLNDWKKVKVVKDGTKTSYYNSETDERYENSNGVPFSGKDVANLIAKKWLDKKSKEIKEGVPPNKKDSIDSSSSKFEPKTISELNSIITDRSIDIKERTEARDYYNKNKTD